MPILFLALFALVFSPVTSFAQSEESSVQAQCFADLKENIVETTVFNEAMVELERLSYDTVEAEFSSKYPTLLPFDLGVDEPVFTNRIYSFGEQTGYTHPPVSAFPSSIKSVAWAEPVKKFVIGEEYVTDEAGKEHFISCFFIGIDSTEPLAVTQDRYYYDAPGVSLRKVSPEGSYKALYNQIVSYDYQNKPFVRWKRLLVYPADAQNTYFSKYAVADAQLANNVESFDVLNFFSQSLIKIEDFDAETGEMVAKYYTADTDSPVEVVPEPVLVPVGRTGADLIFPPASYYEAIEATFPEFATKLSVEGAIKYQTFMELMMAPTMEPEIEKFLQLYGNRVAFKDLYVSRLAGAEQGFVSTDLERQLLLVQNGDWTIAQLRNGALLDELIFVDESTAASDSGGPTAPDKKDDALFFLALLVFAVGSTAFLLRQIRRKTLVHDDNQPVI